MKDSSSPLNTSLPHRFKSILTFLLLCLIFPGLRGLLADSVPPDADVLVEMDAIWRFYDAEEAPPANWAEPDFDDTLWGVGEALLGYDVNNRANRWPAPGLQTHLRPRLESLTYYFRTEFHYSGDPRGQSLFIEQIIDDGAVYFLNGREIARSALMPEGGVGHGTSATGITNPWSSHEILEVSNPPLRQGRNVLAVSLHNASPNSSDICLGARVSLAVPSAQPLAIYLTWQRDPTSTMTVQWHTDESVSGSTLSFFPGSSDETVLLEPATRPMPFSTRLIHTVEITGLNPDTPYHFRLNTISPGANSPVYSFHTMPETAERPIRVIFGGDVRHERGFMDETNLEALRLDPDFIVWGGDHAYADGREDRLYRWVEFFDSMRETLITEEGRVIPVIFGIGNHEIRGGYYWGQERGRDAYEDSDAFRDAIAPYYYSLFAFPGHPGYGVLDFGDYLSILLLDTDHSGPVEGRQTEWLAARLAERQHIPHVIPVYHVPAFPSFRPFTGGVSTRIREHWVPLFEQFGVELAFEHHDHIYKRTVPILREEASSQGIVYMGDGAWGVRTRSVGDYWYLEQAEAIRHLILVSLQGKARDLKVISHEGRLIDHFIDEAGSRSQGRLP